MKAEKFAHNSFNTSGNIANISLMVSAEIPNSAGVNVTVRLSNTVGFMEHITSSISGVRSTLKSNTWNATSHPYCYKCMLKPWSTFSRI